MLDVHPPEHTPHSWRDFFTHIATIVVGLVIAVGLEQTVELIHRHMERAELRKSLSANGEKIIFDCKNADISLQLRLQQTGLRISQVRASVYGHTPLAAPPTPQFHDFDEPDDAAWKAAKTNGTVNLLSEEEIQVFSEIDGLVESATLSHQQYFDTGAALRQFTLRYPVGAKGKDADLSSMSPAEMDRYLDLLSAAFLADRQFLRWVQGTRGAQESVLRGERNLDQVESEERKYENLPPYPGNLPPSH